MREPVNTRSKRRRLISSSGPTTFEKATVVFVKTVCVSAAIQFESPQGHLPKANPCAYRATRASKVLRVPLGLVDVCVSQER